MLAYINVTGLPDVRDAIRSHTPGAPVLRSGDASYRI